MLSTIFNDLYGINTEISNFFREGETALYRSWPRTNIYENDSEYVVSAKVPGINKEDISITIKDNSLKISGEVKRSNEEVNYHLKERRIGEFERNFLLSDKVEMNKIQAELNNGILEIKIPKSPELKPKKINIK